MSVVELTPKKESAVLEVREKLVVPGAFTSIETDTLPENIPRSTPKDLTPGVVNVITMQVLLKFAIRAGELP
jgi:hypothetical protein